MHRIRAAVTAPFRPEQDDRLPCDVAQFDIRSATCQIEVEYGVVGLTHGVQNVRGHAAGGRPQVGFRLPAILRLRGKQAFTFYDRTKNKSLRIVLKEKDFASKEEKHEFMREAPSREIFAVETAELPLPAPARIYGSHACSVCGERTAEPWMRVKDGKFLCLDCCEGADLRG